MRHLTRQKRLRSRARRLQIEPLEDRRLLAITSLTVGSPMLYSTLAANDGGADISILEVVNLTIQDGGSINANDPAVPPNAGASPPIVIQASGNVLIEADTNAGDDPSTGGTNTGIFAENRISGGLGGNITLTVGGSLAMESGATISSSDTAGGNPNPTGSGDITIDVNGAIDVRTGAFIAAGYFDSNPGSGGAIDIKTQVGDIDIDGFVLSQSHLSGTGAVQAPGGGTIFITAGVKDNLGSHLTISDTGVVSSKGKDPGADLVHLQGCGVTIFGLVESTGAGHAIPNNPPNHLDGTFRPDKPANSTGGVEVWAGHSITIDSTGSHNGEINADIGITGGTQGIGWIDLFSRDGAIKIIGDVTGPFAVHANGGLQQNTDAGGLVTVKSTKSEIIASGLAIQADSTTGGSNGGVIVVEALGNVNLNTATISAQGDTNPVGGLGDGGTLSVRSFAGNISWTSGTGDVRPDGTINLTAFGTITLGATFAAGSPNQFNDISGGRPTLPDYVILPLCVVDPRDFGDAPENPIVPGDYPTTLANDGARHHIVAGFHLGATIDAELDGQPNGTATGDDENPLGDPDDEDGVIFNEPFVPGLQTSITVTLTGQTGLLDAWFDWNGDGFWDAGEQVFTNQVLNSGANALDVDVPLTAVVSVTGAPTFARFRLSSAGGLSPTGEASDGEVEDYKLHIFPYWTSKCAVITQIGECFAIPDVLVDVDSGPLAFDASKVGTLMPATRSIQAAIDYVNAHGDVNGDGKLLVAVTAQDTLVESAACGGIPFIGRDLGGDGFENFIVTNSSGQQLYVMGNSVSIHAADPTKAVATIKSSLGKVTYMDIHGLDSKVAGIKVGGATAAEKNAAAVLVKNTSAQNNVGGVGIWVCDDKVEVSGSQHLTGNKVGIQIDGDNNVLRTNNEIMDNTLLGIKVTGNYNELNDQDVGKSGHANGAGIDVTGNNNNLKGSTVSYNAGIGVRIAGNSNIADDNELLNNAKDAFFLALGNSNQITNNKIFGNGGDGIEVTGNSNLIKKNAIGDKNKGNGGDGIRVVGNLNQILENEIFANWGDGIELLGDNNTITKNKVGDKSKGGNGLGNVAGNRDGIRVTGKTNLLEENTVSANKGYGFYIAGAASTGNKLKNNKGNADGSGSTSENGQAEYKFDAAIVNLGGNKKDNANFTSTAVGTYE
ncbi:right-handed parallel beta-helix repeat-containing protein [Candidatus Parcubacteria bacterium]|nr:right-handed parallel beta-helix repeat-containing protein [Candidatus Parcubacteria bacterium]